MQTNPNHIYLKIAMSTHSHIPPQIAMTPHLLSNKIQRKKIKMCYGSNQPKKKIVDYASIYTFI